MSNEEIAGELRLHATELSRSGNNMYRIRAFRQAAMTILALPTPVDVILSTTGREGLHRLPGIGRSLAETIEGIAMREERMVDATQLVVV